MTNKRRIRLFKVSVWTLLISGGVGVILYPHAADWFSTRNQAGSVAEHVQATQALASGDVQSLQQEAHAYNRDLATGQAGHTSHENPDYLALLRPEGSSLMGTVTIPSLGTSVPIYHGTSEDVLVRGAGHQYGTSLPVGGPSTHSVITAHTGLIRASLFTGLDQMREGDVFHVTTAGSDVWYQVDRIVVTLPGDYHEHLGITPGEDRISLFTCTPTGVNSHRLIVSGTRIDAPTSGDIVTAEYRLAAGFPWWAVLFTGTVVAAGTSGRFLYTPKRQPQSEGVEQ